MTEAIGRFGATEAWPLEREPEPSAPAVSAPEAGPSPFERALHAVGHNIDQGEALVAGALRGNLGGLDAGTLIAIQAGIYRYTEAVDLAAKLVDRAGNSVRTVLTGSGQ